MNRRMLLVTAMFCVCLGMSCVVGQGLLAQETDPFAGKQESNPFQEVKPPVQAQEEDDPFADARRRMEEMKAHANAMGRRRDSAGVPPAGASRPAGVQLKSDDGFVQMVFHRPPGNGRGLDGFEFSPDGETVVAREFTTMKTFRWPDTGSELQEIAEPLKIPLSVSFEFLGNRDLMVLAPFEALLYRLNGRQWELKGKVNGIVRPSAVCKAGDGSRLALVSGRQVQVFEAESMEVHSKWEEQLYPESVKDCFLNHDGTQLLVLQGNRICLCDLELKEVIETLHIEGRIVNGFSDDGRFVIGQEAVGGWQQDLLTGDFETLQGRIGPSAAKLKIEQGTWDIAFEDGPLDQPTLVFHPLENGLAKHKVELANLRNLRMKVNSNTGHIILWRVNGDLLFLHAGQPGVGSQN